MRKSAGIIDIQVDMDCQVRLNITNQEDFSLRKEEGI